MLNKKNYLYSVLALTFVFFNTDVGDYFFLEQVITVR